MKSNSPKRITALLERIGRLLTTEAHAEGLLPVHWETLRYLNRANRFSLNAAALTAYLGLTKGTVSQSLGSLESKDLIRKSVDSRDKRSKRLSLTAKGRSMLKRDPIHMTTDIIGDLSSTNRHQLASTLEVFLSARLAAQERQPFGQCQDCRYFALRHPHGAPHYCQLLEEKLAERDALTICIEQRP